MTTEERPPLLCRIAGHKWEMRVRRDDEAPKGMIKIEHVTFGYCRRCGAPNPGFGEKNVG